MSVEPLPLFTHQLVGMLRTIPLQGDRGNGLGNFNTGDWGPFIC